MEAKKKCTRLGCQKEYLDKENINDCCLYHDGKPLFHDIKKGWTCCNTIVYDWDEFLKIVPCKKGLHTSEPAEKTEFFKSQAVSNAQKGIDNDQGTKKVLNIVEYEAEEKRKAEEKKRLEGEKPKEIVKTLDGKYCCGHHGCESKFYDPNDNKEGSCRHHLGVPMFHDRKKFWTCCKQEAYDWDDFEKIAPCATGIHIPKYK